MCIYFVHGFVNGVFNTLRPRQNGRYFADDIFKCIFLNENAWISLKISLKFVPKVRISNIPALVQIMAWRRPGDKPLSEPVMVSLLTHICVARPQWVNVFKCFVWFGLTQCGPVTQQSVIDLVQHWYRLGIGAWRRRAVTGTDADLFSTGILRTNLIWINIEPFTFTKMRLKIPSAKCRPFCSDCNVSNTIVIIDSMEAHHRLEN